MKKKLLYQAIILLLGTLSIACSNSDEYIPNISEEEEVKVIYSELFSDSIKAFTAVSVSGAQNWTWATSSSGSYAYMNGYVGGQNLANETWLISPEINLSDVKAAHFTFEHVARYFANPISEATVWISENYTQGAPASATWQPLTLKPFSDPGSWKFGTSGEISLTPYAGKKVKIAFKYISTTTKAGSWEVKNFVVSSGEAKIVKYNYGEGTQEVPYTVLGASVNQSSKLAWVKGYVVGYAWDLNSFYFKADTCTQKANVILADTIGGFYLNQCVAVQLPRGNTRNAINLKENKGLLGKKIAVYGTLSGSFGIGGVVNISKYILPDGTSGVANTTIHFSETFASNLGTFTANNVKGTYTWRWISGYASMSGYGSGTNYENEDWLISPEIDLTSLSSAGLSFDHTINKGVVANMKTEQTLWITKDNGTSWKKLAIPTYPAGNNWTFVNSGEIDLDAFAGSKIKIAFKYNCTTSASATWEIKNFKVFY